MSVSTKVRRAGTAIVLALALVAVGASRNTADADPAVEAAPHTEVLAALGCGSADNPCLLETLVVPAPAER